MKKGQIEYALFIMAGLILVIGGTVYAGFSVREIDAFEAKQKTQTKYVGDVDTRLVYDKTKCNVYSDNTVTFQSLEQAHSLGFRGAPNCT